MAVKIEKYKYLPSKDGDIISFELEDKVKCPHCKEFIRINVDKNKSTKKLTKCYLCYNDLVKDCNLEITVKYKLKIKKVV